jgi:hypothetical protein
LRLLVPAYFYPAGEGLKDWERLLAAAAKTPIVAVVNPASGPGEKADPAYVALLARAKGRPRLTLIGYVDTNYGKRPPVEVKADVDRWLRIYPSIEGIFFDRQASAAGLVRHFADRYRHVRQPRRLRLVVTNPGTICAEAYLATPATDVACLFEGFEDFAAFRLPKWAAKYPSERFAALVYRVGDAEQIHQFVTSVARKGLGTLYIADAAGANPWDRLPVYWKGEVEAAGQVSAKGR